MAIKILATLALCSLGLLSSCGADPDTTRGTSYATTLVFSAIPDDDETQLRQKFDPMAAYLSEELKMKVTYKPVANYQLAVTAMTSEEIHLAWFGGLTGVQARDRTRGQAIAQGEADAAFYSYLIAHPSSGLKKEDGFPKGIQGKSITFGSESSTSGRLMPEAYIREHLGESPQKLFSKVGFSGSHNLTVDLVANGTFEIGAVNGKTWETMKASGKTKDAYVIWKTPYYADYNWSVPGNLDDVYGPGFRAKLKSAILALDPAKPAHKLILDNFKRRKFIAAENSDYEAIRTTAESLKLIRKL